jgi:hypothetical protein
VSHLRKYSDLSLCTLLKHRWQRLQPWVFLGMMLQAWHTSIWGVSPILFCRSSQALSGRCTTIFSLQNTSLNVNSEEATPGCWPSGQSSSVQCLCSLPILIFYWPVREIAFSLQLCLEGQHPEVASSLLTLRLVFCGYDLMKLPVEDLRGVWFSY